MRPATPLDDLDESIDDEVVAEEPADGQCRVVAGEEIQETDIENLPERDTDSVRRGRSPR